MKDINFIRENYINFLGEKEKDIKDTIIILQKENRIDEANLEKIKLNVVKIFSRMFIISNNDNPEILREKYLGFFDKITGPWYVNRDKALEFEKEEDVIIEKIKIQEAEILKKKFKNIVESEVI